MNSARGIMGHARLALAALLLLSSQLLPVSSRSDSGFRRRAAAAADAAAPSCAALLQQTAPGTDTSFIDADTAAAWCTKPMCRQPFSVCGKANAPKEDMVLVFSDEFEQTTRNFKPGCDSKWQALNLNYFVNGDQAAYKPEAVTVKNGSAVITVTREQTTSPSSAHFGETNMTLPYKSGMLQGWNKFCYTGGYLEVRVKLPGGINQTGLWPAVFTMGNLGRAGYVNSTEGLWPYSYDTCDQSALERVPWSGQQGQLLNRCNSSKGRGAPEIDLIEVGIWSPGNPSLSTSLQLAPLAPPGTIWLDLPGGMYFPTSPDAAPNSTFRTRPNDWAGLNSYYLHPRPGTELQDAVSAVHNLDATFFDSFHTFGVDWVPGDYLRWYIDDTMIFELNSLALKSLTNALNQTVGERQIPLEASYIIMNVAMSDTFTLIDPNLPLPAHMEIDYVRVYQYNNSINIGCDPPDFPTSEYIACNLDKYMLKTWPDYVDLNSLSTCTGNQSAAAKAMMKASWLKGMCNTPPPPRPPPPPPPAAAAAAGGAGGAGGSTAPSSSVSGLPGSSGATHSNSPASSTAGTDAPPADAVDGGSGSGGGMSGVMLGAVAGCVVGVLALGVAAFWWYRRRRQAVAPTPEAEAASPPVKPAAPQPAAAPGQQPPPPPKKFLALDPALQPQGKVPVAEPKPQPQQAVMRKPSVDPEDDDAEAETMFSPTLFSPTLFAPAVSSHPAEAAVAPDAAAAMVAGDKPKQQAPSSLRQRASPVKKAQPTSGKQVQLPSGKSSSIEPPVAQERSSAGAADGPTPRQSPVKPQATAASALRKRTSPVKNAQSTSGRPLQLPAQSLSSVELPTAAERSSANAALEARQSADPALAPKPPRKPAAAKKLAITSMFGSVPLVLDPRHSFGSLPDAAQQPQPPGFAEQPQEQQPQHPQYQEGYPQHPEEYPQYQQEYPPYQQGYPQYQQGYPPYQQGYPQYQQVPPQYQHTVIMQPPPQPQEQPPQQELDPERQQYLQQQQKYLQQRQQYVQEQRAQQKLQRQSSKNSVNMQQQQQQQPEAPAPAPTPPGLGGSSLGARPPAQQR